MVLGSIFGTVENVGQKVSTGTPGKSTGVGNQVASPVSTSINSNTYGDVKVGISDAGIAAVNKDLADLESQSSTSAQPTMEADSADLSSGTQPTATDNTSASTDSSVQDASGGDEEAESYDPTNGLNAASGYSIYSGYSLATNTYQGMVSTLSQYEESSAPASVSLVA